MIILDTITKSLEVVLAAAVATNQLPIVASWSDVEQSAFGCTGLGETDANTNSLTAVTAVAAPAATTSRIVKYLSVQNADTAAVIATVRINNNGTIRKILTTTLQPNDTLVYRDGRGFAVSDANGNGKTGTGATFLGSGSFQKLDSLAASFTGAQTVFTLTTATVQVTPGTAENLLISLDGIIQEPETTYTVTGNTITFSSAPAANAAFFGVLFGGTVTGQMSPSALSVTGNTALGNTVINGSLVVNSSFTVTTTGNIDDLDFANAATILMNNASLSTIRGLKAGQPGQIVSILSIGAGEVDLAHANVNSLANNRLLNSVTSGVTPLAPLIATGGSGKAVYQYDAVILRWRLIGHIQGGPIAYTPTWTGGGTLTFGSVTGTLSYQVIGNRLFLNFFNVNGTLAGSGSTIIFTLPNGYTIAASNLFPIVANPNGAGTETVFSQGTLSGNTAFAERYGGTTWPTGSTTLFLDGDYPIT